MGDTSKGDCKRQSFRYSLENEREWGKCGREFQTEGTARENEGRHELVCWGTRDFMPLRRLGHKTGHGDGAGAAGTSH